VSAGAAVLGVAIALGALMRGGAVRAPAGAQPVAALATLRPYLRFAVVLFLILSLGQVVQRIDILLVEGFRGARDAGLYAVAAQIGDLAMIVPAAVGTIVFRRGSLSAEGHWHDALRAIALTAVVSVAVATVLGLAAPEVIDRLVGSEYAGSVAPLRLLLPGIVVLGVQTVISNYVVTRGHETAVLRAWLTAAAVGVVADLFVIPAWGIEGAAVVSSMSYLIVMAMHVSALRASRSAAAGGSAPGSPVG
jgi:O-antigen/teichoic acid export membrane protein